jgi:hypothetical protein
VTVVADHSCRASASIDAGSDDADSDLAGCTQSPAGPYPLGTTNVTLTCIDTDGQSASCSANVTVVRRQHHGDDDDHRDHDDGHCGED